MAIIEISGNRRGDGSIDRLDAAPAVPVGAPDRGLELVLDPPPWGSTDSERAMSVAVLLPCMNEELTIAKVVSDFLASIPGATVYVYDNASTDGTVEAARTAGAIVCSSPQPGKGNVIRRMFTEIDASIYVLADGDDTYDAQAAPRMIRHLCARNLDMVVGERIEAEEAEHAYRAGHRLGNRALTQSVRWVFGRGASDMLSGYRVLSPRYVKSFPASSCGFETETEMTVHALELHLPFEELPTAYRDRPQESKSKLRTLPDGYKILKFITLLLKDYRPLAFFGTVGVLAGLAALVVALVRGGSLSPWTLGAFVGVALGGVAVLSTVIGIVLDSLGRSRRDVKRMLYLAAAPEARPSLLDI